MKKILFLFVFICAQAVIAQEKSYTIREININEGLTGDLYQTKNTETVILLIAGSGPTDRNGNSSLTQNNALKFLAEGLAADDYSIFSYDKRVVAMINQKIPFEENPDFNHMITDAQIVINYLKNTLHYKDVIIAGHSEGSLVGMVAAKTTASAFISLAGAGNSIDVILKEQLIKQAPYLSEDINNILNELKAGNKVEKVNPLLASLFSPQNQLFLIEWMQYTPTDEIKKLKIPVLIINGTKDLQVSTTEAELLHKALPSSELLLIADMNHVFKKIIKDADNMKSYNDLNMPLHPDLVKGIVTFLRKHKL